MSYYEKNQKAKIVTKVPGPKSIKMRKKEDELIAPGLQGFALLAGIVISEGKGTLVTDVDGNQYLDVIGGIGVNGLGHSHPKWIENIKDQIEKISVGSFTTLSRIKLLELLMEHRPTNELTRPQFYSSGSAAVESALRLAKSYTGKWEFVSFWGGFHGKTMGTLSLMGSDFKKEFGPLVPGCHQVPYANCYRCPFNTTYPKCGLACVEFIRHQIKLSLSKGLAAILIEPMQGTAGNIIPPDDFLLAIQSVAKEFDALLIADEMITGFGRTGTYWGINHSLTSPDIVTIGKQFGGGFPISALISTDKITKATPWSNPSGSSSSYGGNPLAASAASASLQIINEENLVQNSKKMGDLFLNELKKFQEKYSFIDNVRGKGLFLGLDLVKSKKTKESLSKKACREIFHRFLEKGLLTMSYNPFFRIQPSMILDPETLGNIISIMDEVFLLVERERIYQIS